MNGIAGLVFLLIASISDSPSVVRIDGERVRQEEVMIFTRSVLIEEGSSIARMSGHAENINTVRSNMNTYKVGYLLPSKKIDGKYMFSGPVKCWRAVSTNSVSEWPLSKYPVVRNETIRRAMLLRAVELTESVEESANLRLFYLPSLTGHDGRQYQFEPTVIAFFIDPKTGNRMTVMIRAGSTFGSVSKPLSSTSNIYVAQTQSYSAGPFGLGTAHVPSVFYSKKVEFDVQSFAPDNNLNKLMDSVLTAAKNKQLLSIEDFHALYKEMLRYTGGM